MMTLERTTETHTTGLTCCLGTDEKYRLYLFEIDDPAQKTEVLGFYKEAGIGVWYHPTGSGGYHFIGNKRLTVPEWKELHKKMKHINPKCPMTTLRWKPNKYIGESEIWNKWEYQYSDGSSSSPLPLSLYSSLLNFVEYKFKR